MKRQKEVIMKMMTSAAANKYLRALDEEKSYYRSIENNGSTYVLAENEKETTPPDYDYDKITRMVDEINRKICIVKHAVNLFNVTTKLEGFDMTVDQALVYLAQLSRKKARLDSMRKRQEKTRVNSGYGRSLIIEYEYVNYDLEQVRTDFEAVSDEISRLQMAIDYCNQTISFEVNVD